MVLASITHNPANIAVAVVVGGYFLLQVCRAMANYLSHDSHDNDEQRREREGR